MAPSIIGLVLKSGRAWIDYSHFFSIFPSFFRKLR